MHSFLPVNRRALLAVGAFCLVAILFSMPAKPQQVATTAPLTYSQILTATSGPAGFAHIVGPAGSLVVSTTSVTANSQILPEYDETAGSSCSAVTNTENNRYWVSARTAGSSFTIKAATAISTGNTACLSYFIIN